MNQYHAKVKFDANAETEEGKISVMTCTPEIPMTISYSGNQLIFSNENIKESSGGQATLVEFYDCERTAFLQTNEGVASVQVISYDGVNNFEPSTYYVNVTINL